MNHASCLKCLKYCLLPADMLKLFSGECEENENYILLLSR